MRRGELGSASEGQGEVRRTEPILPGNQAIVPGNGGASEASLFFQGIGIHTEPKGERSEHIHIHTDDSNERSEPTIFIPNLRASEASTFYRT